MPGTNKPCDSFHLNPRSDTVLLSPKGEGTPPTPPQSGPTSLGLFWPVLPQPLLLQPCTFLTASVRKAAGNSSHPHSSCAIPPILLWWRGLALVTGGQELSHNEGRKERSLFVLRSGWGSRWGCLLSSFLYCFSFRSSFWAEPRHPVFKTLGCFSADELTLWCVLPKCETILPGEEVTKLETYQLMSKSKREGLGHG